MLPRENRLTSADDFLLARRAGAKAGNRIFAVTIAVSDPDTAISHAKKPLPVRVGFIVPKAQLPRAVDRNRIKRQLRHLMRSRIGDFPGGTIIVIRVFTTAKGVEHARLATHLDDALKRAKKKLEVRQGGEDQ